MAFNLLQKLTGNIAAIKIALAYKQGDLLSDADNAALSSYAGFGGIKAVMFPDGDIESWISSSASEADLRLYEPIKELRGILKSHFNEHEYKEIITSLKHSVLTAYYTPEIIPQTLYKAISDTGISPQRIYEPSAGAGIFITEAIKRLSDLKQVTAVEKDILTGKILTALNSSAIVPVKVHISGLEDTSKNDDGKYDLIVSNIPFGNFNVYDPELPKDATGKIHNYFFVKGLDKIANGGLLVYITTDAFLNNPSNQPTREHLFNSADFISLSIMPDNLMKDTGNTEAPSHLLIVQKNEDKKQLSTDETLLIATEQRQNEFGSYKVNSFIALHEDELATGNVIKGGKNQYGQPTQNFWQDGDINGVGDKIAAHIRTGLTQRFNKEAFQNIGLGFAFETSSEQKKLTFLAVPESKAPATDIQLGLFDIGPAENINRAMAYIDQFDDKVIRKDSARIISTIKTTARPEHESIVLITAKGQRAAAGFLYKLYSNVRELQVPTTWMSADGLDPKLADLAFALPQFGYDYIYSGDQSLKGAFGLERQEKLFFEDVKPFFKDGTLVLFQGKTGLLSGVDTDQKMATFTAFPDQRSLPFYQQYIRLRDNYFEFSENSPIRGNEIQRQALNDEYDRFRAAYGILNMPQNRRLLAADSAFGFQILASLERKDGESYTKADVLQQSLVQSEEHFTTDDPVEALALCLNDRGKVDIGFIEAATGLSDKEVISNLHQHIYLNPQSNVWETIDLYLSGNVVEKLRIATGQVNNNPDNLQFARSLEAISKVQPERIPFELLDFNLGERWIPVSYYDRFATELFEQDTSISYFQSLDAFKVLTKGNNAKVTQEFAVVPKNNKITYGATILEHALENTAPFYTYEVDMGDKVIRLPDNDAIQSYSKLTTKKTNTLMHRFTI